MKKCLVIAMILMLVMTTLCLAGCGKKSVEEEVEKEAKKLSVEQVSPEKKITLEVYEDAAFTMKVPKGWKITTAGQGQDYGIYMYDPENVERQIFYYITFCSYYSNQNMKDFLGGYANSFGSGSTYENYYANMPVLEPATPVEVFKGFAEAVEGRGIVYGDQEYPVLDGFELIESEDKDYGMGNTQALWAKFNKNDTECSGQFMANVYGMDVTAGMMGYAEGSFYVSNMVMGMTAASGEYHKLHDILLKSLTSLEIKQSFVDGVIDQIEATAAAALKRNETMQEAYDSYNDAWHERNKTYDAISTKRSYATRGEELLYNPDTDDTYTVSSDFYEEYKKNPGDYNISNLEPVPDDRTDLWIK